MTEITDNGNCLTGNANVVAPPAAIAEGEFLTVMGPSDRVNPMEALRCE